MAWNTQGGFSAGDSPESHRSQIRIYDLKSRKEVRRIDLPPGSFWSVKSWEGNQLWANRNIFEYPYEIGKYDHIDYSRANRLSLDQENPQPVEYPLFQDSTKAQIPNAEYFTHRRGTNWLAVEHRWMMKKWEVPTILQKITEWLPFTKDRVNEYFPEHGCKVWLADPETGEASGNAAALFWGPMTFHPTASRSSSTQSRRNRSK